MTVGLSATKRTEKGNALDTLRAKGAMPAVVYGPKQEPVSITVNQREFEKVFKTAGESTVVTVSVDGAEIPTLIHEVDLDPITNAPRHADFYAIVKGQKVEVQIPLVFAGESVAVKGGANLVKTMHEVEVEADPMNLPHELSVDLAKLVNVGDQVLVSDIALPAGVTFVTDPTEVVAIAAEAKEEVIEEAPTAVDMAQIGDSVERGKKEEEGEAPAAAE
jgi:large subunit ribosomal protein L25